MFESLSDKLGGVFGKLTGSGKVGPYDKQIWVKDANGEDVQTTEKWMQLTTPVATRIRNRVLPLQLDFKLEPESYAKDWRK